MARFTSWIDIRTHNGLGIIAASLVGKHRPMPETRPVRMLCACGEPKVKIDESWVCPNLECQL